MNGYEYIRNAYAFYMPRTPSAAARAVEKGLLPVEAFIYAANNISPLAEEPINYDELERVLAREDLDLNTTLLLLDILEKLINHKDPEIALFAAESINTIENRYNKKIEEHKELLQQIEDQEATRELAKLYYEIALINSKRQTIKEFYLREAFTYFRELDKSEKLSLEEMTILVRIFIDFGFYSRALRYIHNANPERNDTDLLLLEAEVEFASGNIYRTFELFVELRQFRDKLDEESLKKLNFWIGR